jgi:hypothetical protein
MLGIRLLMAVTIANALYLLSELAMNVFGPMVH